MPNTVEAQPPTFSDPTRADQDGAEARRTAAPRPHRAEQFRPIRADAFRFATWSRVPFLWLFVVALIVARTPAVVFEPRFFAEDGAFFFKQAFEKPIPWSLTTPYAGYRHVLVLLLAEIGLFAPMRYVPITFNLLAVAVEAAVIVWVGWFAVRSIVRDSTFRIALLALLVLLPNHEGLGKLCAVAPYLALGAAFVAIGNLPRGRMGIAASAGFCFLAGMSIPTVWTAFPVIVLRFFTERRRGWAVIGAAVLVSTVLQFLSARGESGGLPPISSDALDGFVRGWSYKAVLQPLLGSPIADFLTATALPILPLAAFSAAFAVLLCALRFRTPGAVRLAILFASSSPLLLLRPHFAAELLLPQNFGAHDRYFLIPMCSLVTLLVGGLASLRVTAPRVAAIFAALLLQAQLPAFFLPEWTPENYRWGRTAKEIEGCRAKPGGCELQIRVNPTPWSFPLSVVGPEAP